MLFRSDQLSDGGSARSRVWGWLPRSTPPHVSLVVSTLPDESHGILAQLQRGVADEKGGDEPGPTFLEVGRLDPSESGPLLDSLLEAHQPLWPPRRPGGPGGRRVTGGQRACLEAAVRGGATALQLKVGPGRGLT